MTSDWLKEMFEGDFADMCANKLLLVLMGDEWNRQVCADGEEGATLVQVEVFDHVIIFLISLYDQLAYYYPRLDLNKIVQTLFYRLYVKQKPSVLYLLMKWLLHLFCLVVCILTSPCSNRQRGIRLELY